ncbi:MAG: HINT domain-containing protein [Pirellula sp.]|nr:HINT domain-containing protein [Pirellula sp.]
MLPLNLPELEVSGLALVTAIDDCPPIAEGEGSVVTARFVTREVHVVASVDVLGADGAVETITGTTIHPVWSVDRQEWVPLAELAEGETLQGLDGLAVVLSVTLSRVSQPVYNIEVHGEHVYQVGELGVLVHNVGSSISGLASKLTRESSDRLRENARNTWQMLTGRRAFWDDLEVHHRIPLEWSHFFGKAAPNRVSNLVGINGKIHKQVSEAWAAWKRSLGERTPTQAEIMEQAFKIDELFKNHWLFPK